MMASESEDVDEQDLSGCESDNSEGDDSSEECSDDESESSFDEMSVGVALELPKRANRGKKYTKLVGEELEKDQQFWGHDTWEEEAVDEDYNCSEGEEQYCYSTDSDFDDPETDESDGDADESNLKEKKRRKHGAYVDPALQRNKRTRIAIERQKARSQNAGQKKAPKRASVTPVEQPVDRSMRATTKRKTQAVIEMERTRDLLRTQTAMAAAKKKVAVKTKVYTQEELMAMALKTEVENTKSLANLQAWEDEKKRYDDIKKWNYKGNYDIWVCWNSLLSIVTNKANESEADTPNELAEEGQGPIEEKPLELFMFTSGKLPDYYNKAAADREKLERRCEQRCVVTGKAAQYRDPLTGLYYCDAAAYRVLRMHHNDTCNTQMASSLDQLEKVMEELVDYEQ